MKQHNNDKYRPYLRVLCHVDQVAKVVVTLSGHYVGHLGVDQSLPDGGLEVVRDATATQQL